MSSIKEMSSVDAFPKEYSFDGLMLKLSLLWVWDWRIKEAP